MSLLLDALDRADKERTQQLPAPSSPASPVNSDSKQRQVKRLSLEVLIGLLILGLVLYLAFFRTGSELNTSNTTVADISPPSSQQTALETAAPQKSQRDITPNIAIQTNTAEAQNSVNAQSTDSNANNTVSKLYQQNTRESLAQADQQQPVSKPEPIAPTPSIDTARPKPQAPQNTSRELSQDFFQQVPLLSDLPTQFKSRVPNLEYRTHVYNKGTQSGFVNLNGPFREVGSLVAPGIRLIAILPEGVVLELDGTLFRLRALNNWVAY